MANQFDEKQWYLAVGERSLGPLSTELIERGIRSGKVPVEAWICLVGDTSWTALSGIAEFQSALNEAQAPAESPGFNDAAATAQPHAAAEVAPVEAVPSAPGAQGVGPQDADEDDEPTGRHSLLPYEREEPVALGMANAVSTELGAFSDVAGQRDVAPALHLEGERSLRTSDEVVCSVPLDRADARVFADVAAATPVPEVPRATHTSSGAEEDLAIDITFDDEAPDGIDWRERFQSYFLVGSAVELPDEGKLLQSLTETPRSTFLHDEALWNLALCLAFGSESVASASAMTLFEALEPAQHQDVASERVEWICRTLLSKGFMPSGIPRMEGNRGVDWLRRVCPPEFEPVIEREVTS